MTTAGTVAIAVGMSSAAAVGEGGMGVFVGDATVGIGELVEADIGVAVGWQAVMENITMPANQCAARIGLTLIP